MKHTEQCTANARRHNIYVARFLTKHPDHCKHCMGWGGKASTYDPSPAGVSLGAGSFSDFDPCEHCAGKCPICADPLDDDEEYCTNCDTTRGQDGLSSGPECLCWESDLNDYHEDLERRNQ